MQLVFFMDRVTILTNRENKVTLDMDWEKKNTRQAQSMIFSKWLNENYQSERTKKLYTVAILTFLKSVYPNEFLNEGERSTKIDEGISQYLNENRDILEDVKKMLSYMRRKDYAPKTSRTRVACVKVFFGEHGKEISRQDWRALVRRKVIPRPIAITADKIPTKDQMRSILSHLPILHKAITLFLLSSSARISETLKLKMDDLDLNADPPKARFRASTTKGGIPRIVRMSYEAKEHILEWLKVKDTLKKSGAGKGQSYNKILVFDITPTGFRLAWKRALRKCGLAQKDSETKIHIYHPHTLRKFGATEWSKRGIPRDVYEGAFMGHEEYLDASYKRYRPEEIDELYKKHMDAITVYGGMPSNFKEKLEAIEKEKIEQTQAIKEKDEELRKVDEMLDKLGIGNDRSREERLLEYFRITQTPSKNEVITSPTQITQKHEASPTRLEQPKQTTPNTPIQIVQKRSVSNEHWEKEAKSFMKVKEDIVWCPDKDDWIHTVKCELCKTIQFNVYRDCRERRLKNPNDPIFTPTKPKPLD